MSSLGTHRKNCQPAQPFLSDSKFKKRRRFLRHRCCTASSESMRLTSAFPDAEREEARRVLLMYADSTASRLWAEQEADKVLAAFKRRDDAQKDLEEILTAAKRRVNGEP